MGDNFVILIGGPGTFVSCDPHHDKTWLNYFYPVQVAAEADLYRKSGENVHWVVYAPPYRARWLDDSDITFWEGLKEKISGSSLHEVRKSAANAVVRQGATNYLNRIDVLAKKLGITYRGIENPDDFWKYLASLPARSISRVWYSGHATRDALILQLAHSSECEAVWANSSAVLTADIGKHVELKDRFINDPKRPSKFYGCNTALFARTWRDTFGVPTEGADSSITFEGVLRERSTVLERLEKTPTPQGDPRWTKY